MSAPGTLTVDLSPEAARVLQEAVDSGDFASPSALIDAVVQSWHAERQTLFGYTPDDLDRLADEAEASGPGRVADFDAIAREARLRFEASTPGR